MNRKNQYIPFYESFFRKLKLSLREYSLKYNVSCYSYFADKLGFKSLSKETQLSNLLNQQGKDLTVRELIYLIEVLKEDAKPILDYLCYKADFVAVKQAYPMAKMEDLKDILISFQFHNGLLSRQFLQSITDNKLSDEEKEELTDLSYNFRSALSHFEYVLNVLKG